MSHSEELLIAYERATGLEVPEVMWNMSLDDLIDMFEQQEVTE